MHISNFQPSFPSGDFGFVQASRASTPVELL
jgi:hypothetical protein